MRRTLASAVAAALVVAGTTGAQAQDMVVRTAPQFDMTVARELIAAVSRGIGSDANGRSARRDACAAARRRGILLA